jgi:glucan phosphoethanolaminetransferase (alkaline phosphatase superfamily)
MSVRRPLGWLALAFETLLWLLPTVFFLSAYVGRYAGTAQAAASHALLLLSALTGLLGLRVLRGAWVRSESGVLHAIALIFAVLWLLLTAYQALVLTGLHSWGRVVSWLLIESYAAQAPSLLASLGLSPWFLLVTALTFLIGMSLLMLKLQRYDLLAVLGQRLGPKVGGMLGVALILVCGIRITDFLLAPRVGDGEPISLTFFDGDTGAVLQSHQPGTRLVDSQAQLAREAYQPALVATNPVNIVVIVVDALRPDRMSTYGAERPSTPRLQHRLQAGTLMALGPLRAICAESSCGLLGMARSRYLHEFSDYDIGLIEVLRKHGYRANMVLGGDHTNFYGLRKAYGEVEGYFDGSMAPQFFINDDALVLAELSKWPHWTGQPQFLQLHLMSTHVLGRFGSRRSEFYQPAANYSVPTLSFTGKTKQVAAENFYDNGLMQTDEVIDRALALLEEKGYLRDAAIFVVGDHGELLGEQGKFGHAKTVLEPVLKVPLLVGLKGRAQREVPLSHQLVSQLDLAPTVADLVGVPVPKLWRGKSVFDLRPRSAPLLFQQGFEVGLYDESQPTQLLKYVLDVKSGEERVHDLRNDPREELNLLRQIGGDRLAVWRKAVAPAILAISH